MLRKDLLINADDFGISQNVNEAIKYCFLKKLIDRTTLMVNMDFCDDAVKLAQENDFYDCVGLHLNLVEGVPLTEDIKHTPICTNGVFDEKFFKHSRNRFYISKDLRKAVKKEIIAQIEKYLSYGFKLGHLDSHQHSHTNPSIYMILLPLAKEYGIKTIRLSRNIPENEISGFKSLYKNILNFSIKLYNKHSDKSTLSSKCQKFGSQTDVDKFICEDNSQNKVTEMEIHPSLDNNGELIELFSDISIETWLNKMF